MEALSRVDWLTLILGIILGIPVAYVIGILAHMHAPRFVRYLESRKLLKTHKTRQQALLIYSRVKAFHDGTRDRYAFYIVLAIGSVVSAILGSMLLLIIFTQNRDLPIPVEYGVILILATLAFLIAALSAIAIYNTARQIERFDDYKAEVEARWGPIDQENS